MKAIAFVLAALLFAGGLSFLLLSRREGAGADDGVRNAQLALEEELATVNHRLEEVLDRIERIEASRARAPRGSAVAVAEGDEAAEGELRSEGGVEGAKNASAGARMDLLAALAGEGEEAQQFRDIVSQAIDHDRTRRSEEQQRRMEDRRREIEEMNQGPFGNFNFRVNSIGKKLNLTDGQKLRYHELLADYSGRIEEMRRTVNREDPEAYKAYRERKKLTQDEFEGLVIQSLTYPQAEAYKGLPSFEKAPGAEATASFIKTEPVMTDGGDVIGGFEQVMFSGDGAGAGILEFKLGRDAAALPLPPVGIPLGEVQGTPAAPPEAKSTGAK